jgi:predicted transcriptional regulator
VGLRADAEALHRLRVRSRELARIGKEVDRLDEDEGAVLEREQPIEYEHDTLADDIDYLAKLPQAATAQDLGITERGWRKILKGDVEPLPATRARIRELANRRRANS